MIEFFNAVLAALLPSPAKPKADAPELFTLTGTEKAARLPFASKPDAESNLRGPAGACAYHVGQREQSMPAAPAADSIPVFGPSDWSN
ncbi:MAG: hypothetical protein AMXMBFR7_26790 [Planctomycetota bacterium]